MDRLSKAFIVLAAIGIVVAIYHGYDEVTAYSAPGTGVCNINSVFSCASVFNSGYTKFPPGAYGVDLYVYGVVWFPLLLLLAFRLARKNGTIGGEVMVPVLMVGNLFTLYLWYLEISVIHAYCPVCISMYVLNYAMTGLAMKRLLGP